MGPRIRDAGAPEYARIRRQPEYASNTQMRIPDPWMSPPAPAAALTGAGALAAAPATGPPSVVDILARVKAYQERTMWSAESRRTPGTTHALAFIWSFSYNAFAGSMWRLKKHPPIAIASARENLLRWFWCGCDGRAIPAKV